LANNALAPSFLSYTYLPFVGSFGFTLGSSPSLSDESEEESAYFFF